MWGLLASGCSEASEGTSRPDETELGFCDVQSILESRCHRCHGEPQENGATIPLVTWEDIQVDRSGTSVAARMVTQLELELMPPLSHRLEPPVEALGAVERERLLEWLRAGAPRGTSECEP